MSKSFEDIYRGLNYDLKNHYVQGWNDSRNHIIKVLQKISEYPPNWNHEDPIESIIEIIKEQE
jgi:hypothetical protein